MAASHGAVNIFMQAEDKTLRAMMTRLETSLAPAGIGAWLGGAVSPYLAKRAKNRFQSEGDDVTGKWEPLSGPTQHIRESQGYGAAHPINHRTGRLEQYITGSPNRISIHSLGATLTFPGKAPVGEMHTKVKTAQRGKLDPRTPPRPVLGVNETDLLAVMTSLSLYISQGQIR